jgi:hypothetical protein
MKKLLIVVSVVLSIPVVLFLTVWLLPRPADTTPSWVFDGDGTDIDYCELPVLDGSGLMADDIPQAFTPGCGYTVFPRPILKGCTEPLPEGTQDIRGLWQSVDEQLPDHVERVEQCGDRVVVTAHGLIHDHAPDMLSNDVAPRQIGPFLFCLRTSQATAVWKDNQLHQKLFGGPTVVKRYIEDGVYRWEFPGKGTIRMKRICKLPEHAKTSPDRSHAL